jgi:predicted ferric reductase
MDRTIAGLFWLLLYLAVVLVPVFLMLVPPVPSGRPFWLEFSIALGFVGLTQIGLQFLLIARFKRVTAPYGIDIILRYHRQIALVAVAAILLHPLHHRHRQPVAAEAAEPAARQLGQPLRPAQPAGAAGHCRHVAVFRERLRIGYERWRLLHLVLGVGAIVFAQLHASMAGLYINTAWKQAVWIVMAASWSARRLPAPDQAGVQRSRAWRVAEVRDERGDTHTLAVEPVGHDGIRFEPGQFAWIKIAGSPFTLEEHPFSFASSAERTERIEFGIKALGDFTSPSTKCRRAPARTSTGRTAPSPSTATRPPGYVLIRRRRRHHAVHVDPAHHGRPRRSTPRHADLRRQEWDDVAYREDLERLRDRLASTSSTCSRSRRRAGTARRGLSRRNCWSGGCPTTGSTATT